MAEFDVRKGVEVKINVIRIADYSELNYNADVICDANKNSVIIGHSGDSDVAVLVEDKKHADNLIKGLEKAQQLGWLK